MTTSLLVTLADKNYISHTKQLFSSVYYNAGWKGDYMVLTHGVPAEDLIWFRSKGILVKECPPVHLKDLAGSFPISTLNKFNLFTPEFKKWTTVVFLDPDIIVRHSIDILATVKGFCAVQDFYTNGILKNQFINFENDPGATIQLTMNFNLRSPALNTGVMAFSTDIITEGMFTELLHLGNTYGNICRFAEQSILNLYFYKKWNKLNFLYNFMMSISITIHQISPKKFDPIILHFCDKPKPWDPQSPFYSEWKVNFDKVDGIDINNRPAGSNHAFTRSKYVFYRLQFIILEYIFFIKRRVAPFVSIDRHIGRAGIALKKISPGLYHHLKKII